MRIHAGEITDLQNPALWLKDFALGRKTAAGEHVSAHSALTLSFWFSSLRNLGEDLAKMPLVLRRPKAGGRGFEKLLPRDHHVARLLKRPNPIIGGFQMRRTLVFRTAGWGNGHAEILRNRLGQVVELWPIHPARIYAELQKDGRTVRYPWQDGVRNATLGPQDVLHIKGVGDGINGLSVIKYAAESLGFGLAAQRHGSAFFGEGMAKRMIALVKETLDPKQRKQVRRRIEGDRENDAVGFRKLPIVDIEVDLKDVGIPPQEAQFIESREFSVEDGARWLRMSLAKLQHDKRAKGWSTLDALNTEYVIDALMPWACAVEEELENKLLTDEERDDGYQIRHNFNGLLKGDFKTRSEGYARLFQIGVYSANDIRDLEEMNPREDEEGDAYFTQGALRPAGTPYKGESSSEKGDDQVEDDDEPADDEDDEDGEEAKDDTLPPLPPTAPKSSLVAPVIRDAAARVASKEASRLRGALKRHATDAPALEAWAKKAYLDLACNLYDATCPALDVLTACGAKGVSPAEIGEDLEDAIGACIGRPNAADLRARAQRGEEQLAGEMFDAVMGVIRSRLEEDDA